MRLTIDDVHLQFANSFPDQKLRPWLYLLSKKMSEGHICLPLDQLPAYAHELPPLWNASTLKKDQLKTSSLVDQTGQAYKPFIQFQNHLYFQRYFQYETQILNRIRALIALESAQMDARKAAIHNQSALLEKLFIDPTPSTPNTDIIHWQAAAVLSSALHNFSIITGGPGTGKTTSVRNLIALLWAIQPDARVALAAPTGKAAARISESLKHNPLPDNDATNERLQHLQPTTLHRLLGWQKDSIYFKHKATNPLPYDVVVVDECSMIDVAFLAKLLDAIGDHTRLILLGDKNQLASVEAGSVFGDLCQAQESLNFYNDATTAFINDFITNPAKQIPRATNAHQAHPLFGHVTELRRSRRFNDHEGIGQWSKAIITSDENAIAQLLAAPHTEVHFDKDYQEVVFEKFVSGYAAFIQAANAHEALQQLQNLRVLCAVRQGAQGLYQTNKRIERWLQTQGLLQIHTHFYEHRPVMLTQNRYDLGLFNGDTGIVRKHPETGELMAYFEDSNGLGKWVMTGYLHQVETAFALTIHKSQGSEFDQVLVLLPHAREVALITRELLYTAITRAKRSVVIQSDATQFMEAIQHKVARASGIANRFDSLLNAQEK